MIRYLPNPLDPAVFHGHMGIQTFCDSFGDNGQLIGLQLLNHFLLPGNDGVNLAALAVKVVGNAALLIEFWNGK